ncbi:(3,5-dihydroxyphenyl)acetyl-CoA 1,2-dioxygenase DpgC [Streptomyces sp. GMR22]|uniref:(3,5-dihydroxyphenyl)acetyl-CoA 1,2-dioxygenase DpgC n=1 Tax=Streptomyces sp. GMR22 TaxID=2759524 RepID=UPI002D811362|nr:(3,5-dihydroxyphenyl)acetyl-CoA 1,2-dioxygenase DpgC [Streptomyces sp. GMR22]
MTHFGEADLPMLSGRLDDDAAVLACFTGEEEKNVAELPVKPERDARQQKVAETVFASTRVLRDRFMALHADDVYDAVTDRRTARPRLAELAFAAAERFPGLVPTRAQLDAERKFIQAHKDGREIDQGVFFRGLLRSPVAGHHLMETMLLASPRALRLLDDFRRTGDLDLGAVRIRRLDGAAHLTIDNGHCLNAEDDGLVADLETAVDLALLDDEVRVGAVRGAAMNHPRYLGRRVFSAGINLKDLQGGHISFVDFLLRRELGFISKIFRGLRHDTAGGGLCEQAVHKPWVAAVDSFAIGGGMQLLLVFDRVIAADDAYFSLPAAQEGIVPGAGNLRLTRLTGARLARQVVLSGRKIAADSPEGRLICDEAVPTEAVDGAVDAAVRELDAPAVVANRAMLHLAEEPPDLFRAYMAEFAMAQATRLYSADVLDKVGTARTRAQDAERSPAAERREGLDAGTRP